MFPSLRSPETHEQLHYALPERPGFALFHARIHGASTFAASTFPEHALSSVPRYDLHLISFLAEAYTCFRCPGTLGIGVASYWTDDSSSSSSDFVVLAAQATQRVSCQGDEFVDNSGSNGEHFCSGKQSIWFAELTDDYGLDSVMKEEKGHHKVEGEPPQTTMRISESAPCLAAPSTKYSTLPPASSMT